MKPSVVKAVNALLRGIEECPESLETESKMRSWLVGQGYSRRDIDAALKIVVPRLAEDPVPVEESPRPPRQLALYEHAKLTPEARSALARLDMHELMGTMEREALIERLMQLEGELDVDALDYLLSTFFCTMRNVEMQNAMFNTFEGFGPTLH